MLNLNPKQIVSVWNELELAYRGENKFGTDTAEINAYHLTSCGPTNFRDSEADSVKQAKFEAAQNLYWLIKMFVEIHDDAVVWVDDQRFNIFLTYSTIEHRAHVRIQRAPAKG
jgi:hypothetical protein